MDRNEHRTPSYYFAIKFEEIIASLFGQMDFSIEKNVQYNNPRIEIDLIAYDKTKQYIEIKFYRSKNVPVSTIKSAANALAFKIKGFQDGRGLLILNINVPPLVRLQILADFDITVWGIDELIEKFDLFSIDLKEQFEKLLLEAQQGTELSIRPQELINRSVENEDIRENLADRKPKKPTPPPKTGEILSNKLKALPCGRKDWVAYEKLVIDILRFLFEKNDLSLWEKQARTDDELSRFDLICRINGFDDFWKAIISSFNTRFVLFEFKNYCEEITQGQVYTTERYLFQKALRSVGYIISRKGGNQGAINAAKGSLREHGKLVLLLSDEDLHEMLRLKDDNANPNDYLSDLLDQWLIGLSR